MLKYSYIALVFTAHSLIPIRTIYRIESLSIAMFISAAVLIFIIDTFLYAFTITGLHFYLRRTKHAVRNMILIYSIIAVDVVYTYINVYYYMERAI